MANVNFEISKQIGIIGEGRGGWKKEVNLVSWNGKEPKIDIRDWSPEHDTMSKGITLTEDEARALVAALMEEYGCEK